MFINLFIYLISHISPFSWDSVFPGQAYRPALRYRAEERGHELAGGNREALISEHPAEDCHLESQPDSG